MFGKWDFGWMPCLRYSRQDGEETYESSVLMNLYMCIGIGRIGWLVGGVTCHHHELDATVSSGLKNTTLDRHGEAPGLRVSLVT